ncbi:hypothetical protein EYC80_010339 [Monilinia laxa]|uniref:Uncharacterized protein n=1 Tax=Monilinia laxa TaxID=61186 RepID=A0A5N6JRD0_MONLA|nr:hypothetical protein EYC80_010339 [Monilinia laxa]
MESQSALACAKSSPLLPTDSILQDLPYLPELPQLPDLPDLQNHSEQSDNQINLDLNRGTKLSSLDISKLSVSLPPPSGDTKMDNESTLNIGPDATCTVSSSEKHDSNQIPEEDLRKESLEVLDKRSDLRENLKQSLLKCSLALASYSSRRDKLSKCSLDLARVIHSSFDKSSAHQDIEQKVRCSVDENLSKKGLPSYSDIDLNQQSRELNKHPLILPQPQISRDELKPEFEDLVRLKSAWSEATVALSTGKVWRGLDAEQKASYEKAILFRASALNANSSCHWQEMQKFATAIFNIIPELRAVENSTKGVDFHTISSKALSSKLLSIEECKRRELGILNSGTEKRPEPRGLCDTGDELILFNKTECASRHKLCIAPEVDLPPNPDSNTLQEPSDVINPVSRIEVGFSRPKEVHQNILSSLNASEEVLQEPRKVCGPEMPPEVAQEITKRDAFHATITNITDLSSLMATELNLKSQVKPIQDMIIGGNQNVFHDQASTTNNDDKADVEGKSVNPIYEAIQHKASGSTNPNNNESTSDSISKPNDITEKDIGLAALTKANTNTRYTPWCLKLGGKLYKRTCSRPNLMHKRLLCYGLATEVIAELVIKSVQEKDDPIPLAAFRHGVECTGSECKSPKVLINGQPYELFPSKCNRTKPIQSPSDMSKQKLIQPTKVPDSMEANQLPINKEVKFWNFPREWNDSDTNPTQFSAWNQLNTKIFRNNSTSGELLGFLSDETQLMMSEARQKALSVRGMVVETRGKNQAAISSNGIIPSERTQAQEMSIENWLMIADARIKKLSSRDLLVASSEQEQENKTAASLDGTATEFLRAPGDADANPLIYDSEDGRPMEHPLERRTRSRWDFRPKNYVNTQAENIDNMAIRGLERWSYSKPITPSAGRSELSNVTYSTVMREEKYKESRQKLRKSTDAEVNTAKQSVIQDSLVIIASTQVDTKSQKFPNDHVDIFSRAHYEGKPISEDSPAIIAVVQEYSQIKQMVTDTSDYHYHTKCMEPTSTTISVRESFVTSKAQLPKEAHDCKPEVILEDNSPKQVEDTDFDTKSEDDWVMADDEAEEWEII